VIVVNRLFLVAWLYASSATLLRALGFLLTMWIARVLPTEEYSRWGLLYAFQTGLASFGVVGLAEAAIGLLKQCGSTSERAQVFKATRKSLFVTCGISLFIAAVVGKWLIKPTPDVILLASVLASGALVAVASLESQLSRLDEDHSTSLTYVFAVPLAGLIGSSVAFALFSSPGSYFVGSAIGLALAIAFHYRPHKSQIIGDNPYILQSVLRRVPPFIAIAFLGWMSGYGNNFVISSWFDSSQIARFTFAMSIGSLMQVAASSLNQAWAPRFFLIISNQSFDEVESRNRRFYRLQSFALGLISSVALFALPSLLSLAGGNLSQYSNMRTEYFFVLAGYIVLSPWWHASNYYLAHDMGRLLMGVTVVTGLAGICSWVVMMILFGPLGIYIGFFVQMVIRSLGILVASRPFWRLRPDFAATLFGLALPLLVLILTRS
jgi:O-antigen/teichoic acid export membrane protein